MIDAPGGATLPSVEQTNREGREMSATTEENKAAGRACFSNASQGNFDAFESILTGDYILHPEGIRGAAGLAEMVSVYRAALSDLRVDVDHQSPGGNSVPPRFPTRGTHDGDLMGPPATSREVAF